MGEIELGWVWRNVVVASIQFNYGGVCLDIS